MRFMMKPHRAEMSFNGATFPQRLPGSLAKVLSSSQSFSSRTKMWATLEISS
jgi:hypothetical protein